MPGIRICLAVLVFTGSCRALSAAELTARDLASPNLAVLIEVNRPIQILDNALARDLWSQVQRTSGARKHGVSPEFEKFRHLARFVEKSLGGDWQTGVGKLTAGGILVAVQPHAAEGEPQLTVVVTAVDESTLKQFIESVQSEIRRSAEGAKAPDAESTSYRTFPMQRVGNGYFSRVGRQLVVSNTRPGIESALDRLAGASTRQSAAIPQSLRLVDRSGDPPLLLATVNLKLMRQEPKVQELLALPAGDPGPQFLLGGYLDLARRADFASAGLFVSGPTFEIKVRIPAGTSDTHTGLRGYFAGVSSEAAAPLLKPTGALFSASWFRDYAALWNARRQLLRDDLAAQLDSADEHVRAQPTGFGISDLLQWIGPQFRVVAARQREQVYSRKIEERLPAVGLVIGVRDEVAVRDRLLAPLDGLLLVALNERIEGFKKVEYRDARLTTFRFTEKAAAAGPNNGALLHMNPAYALTRGQLLIGSTAEIVRDLIDELDRQQGASPDAGANSEHVTDRQQLFLSELSVFLRDFQDPFIRDTVRNQNITTEEAANDLGVLHYLLNRIASATTSYVMGVDHFDVNVTVGPGE